MKKSEDGTKGGKRGRSGAASAAGGVAAGAKPSASDKVKAAATALKKGCRGKDKTQAQDMHAAEMKGVRSKSGAAAPKEAGGKAAASSAHKASEKKGPKQPEICTICQEVTCVCAYTRKHTLDCLLARSHTHTNIPV